MKKAPKIINVLLLLVSCLMSTLVCAAGTPAPPQPLKKPPPLPGLPIDSGIMVLAIVGLVYSLYFFRKKTQPK